MTKFFHDPIRRRSVLKGAGVSALGLMAAGTSLAPRLAQAADADISLQLNWIKKVDFAGFFIADHLGYYQQEGVTAQLLAGGPGMQGVEQIVAGGSADVGVSTLFTSVVQAVQQGAELVVLGTVFQNSPLALISKTDIALDSAKDLVGKRIGGPQGRQREVDAVFKINGLDTKSYTFVPIGFDPTPLVKGDVDVISVFMNSEPLTLRNRGVETNLITYADLGLPTYTEPVFVTRRYVDENRANMVKWLRATAKGWEMNAKDPELGPRLAVEKYGKDLSLKLDEQIAQNKVFIELAESSITQQKGLLWIDKAHVSGPIYDGLRAAGNTDLPDPDKYIDLSLLEEAYGGKTSLL